MKWNRKKWFAIVSLALSVTSLWFSGWEYFAYKIPLTLTNDFDWFIFKIFHWSHATSNIFFYGPLILIAAFIILALYFWIMGVKQAYDNEKTDILSIVTDHLIYLFSFFISVIIFFNHLILRGSAAG